MPVNCTSVTDVNGNLNPAGYVVTDPSTAFDFGTGDFTMECWAYPTKQGNIWTGFLSTMQNDNPTTINSVLAGVVLGSCSSSLNLTFGINTSFASSFNSNCSNNSLSLNTWQHIALTRASGVCRLFINGIQVGNNIADNRNVNSNKKILGIGKYYSDRVDDWMYNGYIDEVRISKVARYTTNFTPSVSQFVSDSDTVFLCHFDSVDSSVPGILKFYDDGPNNIGITGQCETNLSTAVKKFGNSSLRLGQTILESPTPTPTSTVTPTITPTSTVTPTKTVTPTITPTSTVTQIGRAHV